MKKNILAFAFLLIAFHAFGQEPDTSWKRGGFVNLNFNQVSLNNWEQGGENSVSLAASTILFANYEKGNTTWTNRLELAYAMLKSGSAHLRKNDDKIDFTSKYGHKFADKWYYSLLVNFKSQFAYGYNYPDDSTIVSKFLAPGYVTLALGINYKPVDYFELFLSPATGRITLVNDQLLSDAGAYGVTPSIKTKQEFGAYVNMIFKRDVMENVTLATKLELFDNYTDKDESNRTNVDVNWELVLIMKVNKLLNVNVATQLIYDHNITQRTQFKEVIGIGLGYKF